MGIEEYLNSQMCFFKAKYEAKSEFLLQRESMENPETKIPSMIKDIDIL